MIVRVATGSLSGFFRTHVDESGHCHRASFQILRHAGFPKPQGFGLASVDNEIQLFHRAILGEELLLHEAGWGIALFASYAQCLCHG
jgi:hypothetical protein